MRLLDWLRNPRAGLGPIRFGSDLYEVLDGLPGAHLRCRRIPRAENQDSAYVLHACLEDFLLTVHFERDVDGLSSGGVSMIEVTLDEFVQRTTKLNLQALSDALGFEMRCKDESSPILEDGAAFYEPVGNDCMDIYVDDGLVASITLYAP